MGLKCYATMKVVSLSLGLAVTWTVLTLTMTSNYSYYWKYHDISQNVATSGCTKPVSELMAIPRNDSSLEARTPPIARYILADAFGDQLTGAIRGYYQLAEIALRWNLKIVEPHMNSGKLSGLKGLPRNKSTSLRYGDLFNTSEVYRELDRCLGLEGHKLVTTLDDFLVNATRQLVALMFITDIGEVPGNKPPVFSCSAGPQLSSIEKQLNNYLDGDAEVRRKAVIRHGKRYKFKGVRAICVSSRKFSIHDVEKELLTVAKRQCQSIAGDDVLPELAVVIPEWRLISPNSKTYYFRDPNFALNLSNHCDSYSIPHGEMIMRAADAFSQSLDSLNPTLCIHIRIEALAFKEPTHKGFWQRCFPKLKPAIQSLMSKHNLTTKNIVAMHDMGKYGSGTAVSCSLCQHLKTKILSILHKLGITVIQYDPLNFNQPPNKGFVSLVEKEFLSRSDYLLTVGVGSFQRSLIVKFLRTHSESDLHSIGYKELDGE